MQPISRAAARRLRPRPLPDRGRKLLVVRGQLIKRYFITGLLIWVPLVITGWVLSLIVSTLDQSLRLLPTSIHPQTLLGFAVPGAGAVLTLVMILLTGLLAANFIGQKLVVWWEKLLARIPVVNSVYNSVKQVSDTLFRLTETPSARLCWFNIHAKAAGRWPS